MPIIAGNYAAQATLTYGVYGLIGGAWTRLDGHTVFFYGTYTSGGSKTLTGSDEITVTYSGQIDGFRVVLESVDEGTGGAITGVSNCTWTTQATSGQRSATPSGETITATIRPS